MKKIILIISISIIIILGGTYLYLSNNNYYSGSIDSKTTALGFMPTNEGLVLNIFNLEDEKSKKSIIKYPNSSKDDLVTPIQSDKTFFLMQSNKENVNDQILDVKNKTFIDLKSKGHSIVSESNNYIMLAEYESNQWRLILFNKDDNTITRTVFNEKYVDNTGVRVNHGFYSIDEKTWYIPYASKDGTFLILLKEKTFSIIKLSNDELSDLWILNAANGYIKFYNGFSGSTAVGTLSQFIPAVYIYKFEQGNKLNLVQKISLNLEVVGNNSHLLGFHKKNENEYIMLYKTDGNVKLKSVTISLNNGENKLLAESSYFDIQSLKITNDFMAVASFDKIVIVDQNGEISNK